MIRVQDLHKHYGAIRAVDGVSFEVRAGETFGLLGPNGAGKTTTLLLLVGALRPDGGTIEIAGEADPRRSAVRRMLGLAPQSMALYDDLTAAENLAFFGRLYGLAGATLRQRVDWALDLAGLAERRKHRTRTFSGGMKRRLNLACALVHDPPVLLLDEPTVGVDPQSRYHIFESIEALRAAGRTILYTTHYMEEAQRLCDRVAILDQGRLLALDTVAGLVAAHGGETVLEVELASLPAGPLDGLPPLAGRSMSFTTRAPHAELSRLAALGLEIADLELRRPSLETVFLSLTGRRLRDE